MANKIIVGRWEMDVDYVFVTNCEDPGVSGNLITNAEKLHEVFDEWWGDDNIEDAAEYYDHDLKEITMGIPIDELSKDVTITGLIKALFNAHGYTAKFLKFEEYNRESKCWEY